MMIPLAVPSDRRRRNQIGTSARAFGPVEMFLTCLAAFRMSYRQPEAKNSLSARLRLGAFDHAGIVGVEAGEDAGVAE